jgi:DNA phosphorothioation-dependent restriction protein DptF
MESQSTIEISLKEQLEYLRVSSKGAVVDGNQSLEDPVKRYLHVERKVEHEFEQLIQNVSRNDTPQLVLLIGNVGDGKSHLLANLKKNRPELINKFDVVHNDATASFKKTETYLDTLDKLLKPFNNDIIESDNKKIILAINLGTLANFLEECGDNYTQLKTFIQDKGIFSEAIDGNGVYQASSSFQFINLTDYQLFSLSKDGPVSDIIKNLLDKVTENSSSNPFFVCYSNYYVGKDWAEKCPIKFNYEFLMQDIVKEKFSKIISEAIIRGKMVISIRALLNFFYDALVPVSLANLSTREYESYIENISHKNEEYLSLITPNYIFENPDVSDILKSLNGLDPLISCSEQEDTLLLSAAVAQEVSEFSVTMDRPFIKKCMESSESTKIIPRLSFFENSDGFSPLFLANF